MEGTKVRSRGEERLELGLTPRGVHPLEVEDLAYDESDDLEAHPPEEEQKDLPPERQDDELVEFPARRILVAFLAMRASGEKGIVGLAAMGANARMEVRLHGN